MPRSGLPHQGPVWLNRIYRKKIEPRNLGFLRSLLFNNMLLLFYIVLILVLNLVPIGGSLNTTTVGPLRADYLLHAILFLPWMALVCWQIQRTAGSWRLERKRLTPGGYLLWMTPGIGLAGGVEAMQYFVAARSFNPMDAVFNGVGVVVGMILVLARRG
jgi:glycopeptide antibiotics resistance protein